jgi:hypothetical protein
MFNSDLTLLIPDCLNSHLILRFTLQIAFNLELLRHLHPIVKSDYSVLVQSNTRQSVRSQQNDGNVWRELFPQKHLGRNR